MTEIVGNTYPVKEQLKALGARWNPTNKSWMVDDDVAHEAQAIVETAGPKRKSTRGFRGRRNRYSTTGYGRCEDAPCCGCCD